VGKDNCRWSRYTGFECHIQDDRKNINKELNIIPAGREVFKKSCRLKPGPVRLNGIYKVYLFLLKGESRYF
jgi:hypothetical protein